MAHAYSNYLNMLFSFPNSPNISKMNESLIIIKYDEFDMNGATKPVT